MNRPDEIVSDWCLTASTNSYTDISIKDRCKAVLVDANHYNNYSGDLDSW